MEESQGLLHSPKEQAELYKVNIDLKVKSEELKKVTFTHEFFKIYIIQIKSWLKNVRLGFNFINNVNFSYSSGVC